MTDASRPGEREAVEALLPVICPNPRKYAEYRSTARRQVAAAYPVIAAAVREQTMANRHEPVVTTGKRGQTWVVYCAGCSFAADDYVYPCKVGHTGEWWPPRELGDVAAVREQVAAEIEALRERHFQQYGTEENGPRNYDWALTHAARIARGEAPVPGIARGTPDGRG